jgi:hypothetical protein
MQKWEYAYVVVDSTSRRYYFNGVVQDFGKPLAVHDVLNELGLEGWELVSSALPHTEMEQTLLLFKRPRE